MDATTLDEIKDWMDLDSGSQEHDNELNQLIPAVSRALERPDMLNRSLEEVSRTEVYDLRKSRTKMITLREAPIVEGTVVVKVSSTMDWDNTTATTATDYNVFPGFDAGYIKFLEGYEIGGPTVAQVVYTAGLADTVANLKVNYPAITQAANMWITEVFRTRKDMSSTSTTKPNRGGSITFDPGVAPKVVKMMLKAFRRNASLFGG